MERTKFTGETATQMHHARQGVVTPEMVRVAEREQVEPEFIRDEVARGRMVIPANVHHAALDPMGIGIDSLCKINANIGNSSVHAHVEQELTKLHQAVHFGADTVMDLSTGGDIDEIREAIIAASPVPIGTVPIYQAVQQVTRVEDLTADDLLDEHRAPGAAGRRLHDRPLRCALRAPAARAEPHHRHRLARRRPARAVDGAPPAAEPAVRRTTTASWRSRASTTSPCRSATACGRAASRTRPTRRSSPS